MYIITIPITIMNSEMLELFNLVDNEELLQNKTKEELIDIIKQLKNCCVALMNNNYHLLQSNEYLLNTNEHLLNEIKKIKETLEQIKKENAEIKKENAEIKKENAELKTEIVELKLEIVELKKENAEFKERIVVLEKRNVILETREAKRKIITSLQDLNSIDLLEQKLNNPYNKSIQQLRKYRNIISHYTFEEDDDELIKYKKLKMLEHYKNLDNNLILELDKKYKTGFIAEIINYLESLQLKPNLSLISIDDIEEAEDWWYDA